MQSKFEFRDAPEKTEWGDGMVEALIELGPDSTARLFCHRDDVPLLMSALEDAFGKDHPDTVYEF